MGRCSKH